MKECRAEARPTGEEAVEQRGGLFGPLVMDHVAGAADRRRRQVREQAAQALFAELARHALRQLGFLREHQQERRDDRAPARFRLVALIQHRVDALVLRIGPQLDAAVRALARPGAGDELQPIGRRARVATRQHAHELLVRVVRRERTAALHFVEPLRVARRRLLGIRARQSERFQARRPCARAAAARPRTASRCCRPCCGRPDRAAHPATGGRAARRDRRGSRETNSRRPAAACGRSRACPSRPSVRAARQLIDDELPRLAGIAPAVHEHDGPRILAGPAIQLKFQAAQHERFGLRRAARLVGHRAE